MKVLNLENIKSAKFSFVPHFLLIRHSRSCLLIKVMSSRYTKKQGRSRNPQHEEDSFSVLSLSSGPSTDGFYSSSQSRSRSSSAASSKSSTASPPPKKKDNLRRKSRASRFSKPVLSETRRKLKESPHLSPITSSGSFHSKSSGRLSDSIISISPRTSTPRTDSRSQSIQSDSRSPASSISSSRSRSRTDSRDRSRNARFHRRTLVNRTTKEHKSSEKNRSRSQQRSRYSKSFLNGKKISIRKEGKLRKTKNTITHATPSTITFKMKRPLLIRTTQTIALDPTSDFVLFESITIITPRDADERSLLKHKSQTLEVQPMVQDSKVLSGKGHFDERCDHKVLIGESLIIIKRKSKLKRSDIKDLKRSTDSRIYRNICDLAGNQLWDKVSITNVNGTRVGNGIYQKSEVLRILFNGNAPKSVDKSDFTSIEVLGSSDEQETEPTSEADFTENMLADRNTIVLRRNASLRTSIDMWEEGGGGIYENSRSYLFDGQEMKDISAIRSFSVSNNKSRYFSANESFDSAPSSAISQSGNLESSPVKNSEIETENASISSVSPKRPATTSSPDLICVGTDLANESLATVSPAVSATNCHLPWIDQMNKQEFTLKPQQKPHRKPFESPSHSPKISRENQDQMILSMDRILPIVKEENSPGTVLLNSTANFNEGLRTARSSSEKRANRSQLVLSPTLASPRPSDTTKMSNSAVRSQSVPPTPVPRLSKQTPNKKDFKRTISSESKDGGITISKRASNDKMNEFDVHIPGGKDEQRSKTTKALIFMGTAGGIPISSKSVLNFLHPGQTVEVIPRQIKFDGRKLWESAEKFPSDQKP